MSISKNDDVRSINNIVKCLGIIKMFVRIYVYCMAPHLSSFTLAREEVKTVPSDVYTNSKYLTSYYCSSLKRHWLTTWTWTIRDNNFKSSLWYWKKYCCSTVKHYSERKFERWEILYLLTVQGFLKLKIATMAVVVGTNSLPFKIESLTTNFLLTNMRGFKILSVEVYNKNNISAHV